MHFQYFRKNRKKVEVFYDWIFFWSFGAKKVISPTSLKKHALSDLACSISFCLTFFHKLKNAHLSDFGNKQQKEIAKMSLFICDSNKYCHKATNTE